MPYWGLFLNLDYTMPKKGGDLNATIRKAIYSVAKSDELHGKNLHYCAMQVQAATLTADQGTWVIMGKAAVAIT